VAEGVETRWQRFRKWVATHGNLCATTAVIAGAFCGITSIIVGDDISVVMVRLAMIAVVLAYLFYLAVAFAVPHEHEHRFRYVMYQSAAFIVLALSLRAFSLHETAKHVGAWKGSMDATSVGELAAVMILFILVEVAAFVAQDVDEARIQVIDVGRVVEKIEKTVLKVALDMKNTSDGLIALARLDPSVMTEAITLTNLWAQRAPNLGEKRPGIADCCWRILLQTYLQEEQHDFWPSGRDRAKRLEGIPLRVRPVGTDIGQEDVSYFATNVGFYVKFLKALVDELQKGKRSDEKVCIAVVTNVLPAHWWNWTFAKGEWRAYTAIEDLRKEMKKIAKGGAQIDRVIAVTSEDTHDGGPNGLGLWPEARLYDMLSNWQILIGGSEPEDGTVPCSVKFETTFKDIGSKAFNSFPQELKKGAQSDADDARIYPMITRLSSSTYLTTNQIWTPQRLSDAYQELQGKGKYWPLVVDDTVEKVLKEHFDVMFIGVGPEKSGESEPGGIWDTHNVNWGVCLMNSYDAAVETMFLSVISDPSATKQFEWWQQRLKHAVDWNNPLPQAAHAWMAAHPSSAEDVVAAPSVSEALAGGQTP